MLQPNVDTIISKAINVVPNDGLFFKKAGSLNKNAVPEWALWAQCLVAAILCLSGKYGDLLDMISFVVVLFYVLTIYGIFILRKKRPDAERPYKAFGYPVLPALYMVMGITFCTLLIIYKPQYTWPGLIIVLIGIPLYYITNNGNFYLLKIIKQSFKIHNYAFCLLATAM